VARLFYLPPIMSARIYLRKSTVTVPLLLALFLGSAGTAAAQVKEKQKVDTVVSVSAEGAAKAPQDREVKQIVYKVNPWGTIGSSLVMTAGNVLAISNILHAKKEISEAEIAALRPELLSHFDRWAVEQDPTGRDKWFKFSDVALPATLASTFTIFLDRNIRKDWAKILMMFYQTQAVTFTTYNYSPLGPSFQNRLRPIVYYPDFDPSQRLRGGNRNSLFSGHVANAAAGTFFAVKVYTDYHPEIRGKRFLLYSLASVPPLLVGYARVKALAHFPSDVVLGYVPSLHKIRSTTVQFGVTSTEFGTGPSLTWKPAKKKFKLRQTFAGSGSTALLASSR
jgi:membrane-associated phospholipid phosphatase